MELNRIENKQPFMRIEEMLELKADVKVFEEQGILDMKEIILKDTQPNILKGTKHKYTLFCFLTFKKGCEQEIVSWLKKMPLTSAFEQEEQKNENSRAISLSLSYAGYEFFCDPLKIRELFPLEDDDVIAFQQGLSERCPQAFGGKNRRAVEDNYEKTIHAMILIASNDDRLKEWNKPNVKNRQESLLEFFIANSSRNENSFKNNFGSVFFEIGLRNPDGSNEETKEWFGFKDGISNPRFYPSQNLESNPGFKPDDPSELNVVLRRDKLSPSRYACGSFVVFLKLEQDVEAFNEKVEKLAEKLDMTDYEGYVAAYMMGRHKDGTPLHELFNYPSHGKSNLNDFDFENDPKGEVCPFHSHIRKANARDGQQKRIVRRGKIYGNKKAEQKGLLFLSYQSSLYSFEKIVNSGLYGYNYKTKNTGQDVLFVEKSKYVKNHRYPNAKGKFISPYVNVDRDLITYRGGLYFFTSSISFIRDYLEYCM